MLEAITVEVLEDGKVSITASLGSSNKQLMLDCILKKTTTDIKGLKRYMKDNELSKLMFVFDSENSSKKTKITRSAFITRIRNSSTNYINSKELISGIKENVNIHSCIQKSRITDSIRSHFSGIVTSLNM